MLRNLLSAVVISAAMCASAQEGSIGEREYMSNCASCHGPSGDGRGPLAELLSKQAADLTQLRSQNDGVFPFERVYRVIDGRYEIAGHGTREMPVWGDEYNEEAYEAFGEFYGIENPELFISGRILSLITYIQSIQD